MQTPPRGQLGEGMGENGSGLGAGEEKEGGSVKAPVWSAQGRSARIAPLAEPVDVARAREESQRPAAGSQSPKMSPMLGRGPSKVGTLSKMRQGGLSEREVYKLSRRRSSANSVQVPAPPTPADSGNASVRQLLESKYFSAFMTVITVYALFGDNVRMAAFDKPSDDVFFGLAAGAFVCFLLEMVLQTIARPRAYPGSFFFFLDVMSLVSLLSDIGWIWDEVGGGNSTDTGAVRAGRASRVGTRAGRVVRIVRLVRLVRIAKLLSLGKEDRNGGKEEEEGGDGLDNPSMVGRRISDRTTRYVVILVLAMLFAEPLFSGKVLGGDITHFASGLELLHRYPQDWNVSRELFAHGVQRYAGMGTIMTLSICASGCMHGWTDSEIAGIVAANPEPTSGWSYVDDWKSLATIEDGYRASEVNAVSVTGCYAGGTVTSSECTSYAYFSLKAGSQEEALWSIGKTLFVLFVLVLSSMAFSSDMHKMVVGPIERMVKVVQDLAEDPLKVVQRGKMGLANETKKKERGRIARLCGWGESERYETALLERTITKIGALLQVGFGVAGLEIVALGMSSGEEEYNPVGQGTKLYGCFAFTDIRQFTDTTECLEAEVMLFVNKVAAIAHGAVVQLLGAPNKNVGDAFLFVWKLPQYAEEDVLDLKCKAAGIMGEAVSIEDTDLSEESLTPEERRWDPDVGIIVDNALAAMLKCMVDVEQSNEHGELRDVKEHPEVLRRFGDSHKVRLGFGMHVGWAIEGAIGSRLKIDTAYLSRDVNMSSRLEEATKEYGIPLLLTEQMHTFMSDAAQRRCRKVDRVCVKGAPDPFGLYTFDVVHFPAQLLGDPDERVASFQDDEGIAELQRSLHPDFLRTFEEGLELYLSGDWEGAEGKLQRALELKPGDGPAKRLLQRIEGGEGERAQPWML